MIDRLRSIARATLWLLGYEKAAPPASMVPELEGQVPPAEDIRNPGGPHWSGIAFMAVGALFFALMSLCVKVAGEQMSSQQIVFARAVFVTGISYAMLRGLGVSAWGNQRLTLFMRGIVGFIGLSGFYYSVVNLPLADATVIQYTNPIFATLLAVPILKEHIRVSQIFSLLACVAGVLMITEPQFLFPGNPAPPNLTAILVGLFGAVGSGCAYVLVRKIKDSEHPTVVVYYFGLVSLILSLPLALLSHPSMPTATGWLMLFGVGLTAQIGQVAITRGLAREAAGRAASVGYLQIVFATVIGALMLHEVPELGTICGAILIILAAVGVPSLMRKPK